MDGEKWEGDPGADQAGKPVEGGGTSSLSIRQRTTDQLAGVVGCAISSSSITSLTLTAHHSTTPHDFTTRRRLSFPWLFTRRVP